jgi:hypothetical protein
MNDFYASLAPEPYKVLGVLLRPLSYGHMILLNRCGLDPVTDEKGLALAVQICSKDFREALSFLDSIFTPVGQIEIETLAYNIGEADILAAFSAWVEYTEGHSSRPEYCPIDAEESDRGAPFLAQLRSWLIGHCNYSPDTIMDAPFGQCLWDYGASIEERNGWGIVGDRHRELSKILNN